MLNPDDYLDSEGRKGYLQSQLCDYIFEKHKDDYKLIFCGIERPEDYVSPAIINWIIGERYEGTVPAIHFGFETIEDRLEIMWLIIGSYIIELEHKGYTKDSEVYKLVHSYKATDELKTMLGIINSEITLKTVSPSMLEDSKWFIKIR